jgi:flavin reductase (DIM6/NTAB) family NADH-FMN oxidoreductase RutF
MVVRPLIVISTISKEEIPNAAIITNFMNVSVLTKLAIGCHPSSDTYRNIKETKEFVVNIPPESIIEPIMVTAVDFPPNVNEIDRAGLTAIPSIKVKPPRIKECKIHFECKLDYLKDTLIVGKIVNTSIDEELIECEFEERFDKLQQMFLLGAGRYGKIGPIKELPLHILREYKHR